MNGLKCDGNGNGITVKVVWIPIAVTLFLQAITAAGVVFTMRSDLNHTRESMKETRVEVIQLRTQLSEATRYRYTSQDASRDREAMLRLLTAVNERISASEARLERLEDRLN